MPSPGSAPRVVVVGAGLSGLVAARRLVQDGIAVTVLEAGDQLGGQIRTIDLDGTRIDVGAEAMHLAAPGVAGLIDELDLRETMITANSGASWLVTPRGLRPLPAGVGPAGPTRLRPVLASRVMTTAGLVRAAAEPWHARRGGTLDLSEGHDVSVAEFVSSRFGPQVTARFVDPLLGSLHSGDVHTLSLRACAPALVPAATQARSLLTAKRRGRTRSAPVMSFVSWPDGLDTVVQRILHDELVPVPVRCRTRVTALSRRSDGSTNGNGSGVSNGYRLTLGDGQHLDADAVVLAVPVAVGRDLLRPLLPDAAEQLRATQTASVATIVAGYRPEHVRDIAALRGTGILLPSSVGSVLKATTFLSTKWPQHAGGARFWIRMSVGRAGSDAVASRTDDELLEVARRDLRQFTGLDAAPELSHVQRWPNAMPQLTVGHPDRLRAVRRILAGQPGLALAGASYDGIGLGSCIGSGVAAAELVAAELSDPGRNGRGSAPDKTDHGRTMIQQ